MATTTSIEWTDKTWNPITGCNRVSEGCRHCYAEVMSFRIKNMAKASQTPGRQLHYLNATDDHGHWTGQIELVGDALADPLHWRKPSHIFVNSMSDLFHEKVPLEFIKRVFEVMRKADWHKFQVLTKRSARLVQVQTELLWPSNVWMGVSVENSTVSQRIDELRQVGAAVKWLSIEPLIGPLPNLDLRGINWVVAGGESGRGARPMQADWVRPIRDRCLAAGVPFFFKQWGKLTSNPDPTDPTARQNGGEAKGGRMLDSKTWDQMPNSNTVKQGQ